MELSGEHHIPDALPSGKYPGSYWVRPNAGLDNSVGATTLYGAGRSEGSNPGEGDIFLTVQTDHRTHPAFYTMGIGSLSRC
jgi:hypothetical protein